ncbi:glycerophosphodiester phosphodiesterase family protein [Marilutibacter spongiae]|uniref:glycerophosphodiester phosphodiesterase n=1 Tax=Marilutibacter spongiae TaxID=2025720 RepID=A0A7W3TJI5_9GAMM|nr:glycerophosphodiester phosphodiesterase family protein [Lysobacter spongiae]MBB1059456.1 glycerophosphodiester phosphodiesterase [Lysobacter spongiae]
MTPDTPDAPRRRTNARTRLACLLLAGFGILHALPAPAASPPKEGSRGPAAPSHLRPHAPRDGLIVIAHRGASGYRPEHTLEAYRLAIRQGADFIEPDLVATRDGVLIARHENEISGTTDVASRPEFADRRTTKRVDGRLVTGWFTEDFTLAEIRRLRARERIPGVRPDNARFDGLYTIPTFAEILRLAARESRGHRRVGVYPETKHPTYFAREGRRLDGTPIGISLGRALVETLVAEGFTDPSRVFIQSFEFENLIELHQAIMPAAGVDVPLVQLYDDLETAVPYDVAYNVAQGRDLDALYGGLADQVEGGLHAGTRYGAFATPAVLGWMKANYARGVGPWKGNLLPRAALSPPVDGDGDGEAEVVSQSTARVHPMLGGALAQGLLVHPYTLRAEEGYLAQAPNGTVATALAEAIQLYGLGVNGFFIDQPDVGVAARDIFREINRPLQGPR